MSHAEADDADTGAVVSDAVVPGAVVPGAAVPGDLWPDDDVAAAAEQPAADLARALAAGLAAVPYLRSSLRRRARLWGTAALIGLVLGLGLYALAPPARHASTSVEVAYTPDQNPMDAVQTEVALVHSRAVASRVVRALGLKETPTQLLSSYIASADTDRIIEITASARSGSAALRQVAAVASAFLQFQAVQMQSDTQRVVSSLNQQMDALSRQITATNAAITEAAAPGSGYSQRTALPRLESERSQDESTMASLQQALVDYETGNQVSNAEIASSSGVVDPAALTPMPALKSPLAYGLGGLLLGLVVGLGFVIVAALVSDRLVRREDIAGALGAPVGLSVGAVGARRPGSARERDLQRVVAHLRRLVPQRAAPAGSAAAGSAAVGSAAADSAALAAPAPALAAPAPAPALALATPAPAPALALAAPAPAPALAVVPAGRPRAAAQAVAALAVSCARAGLQVMVADLARGAPAARILGARARGVQQASAGGCHLTVVVPEEIAPTGPLAPGADPASRGTTPVGEGVSPALAAAYQAADVLLTLAAVDPATGAGHLPGWANAAVVMVTAGHCPAARIRAAADVIRLSGIPLAPAILVGSDPDDHSLGTWPAAEPDAIRSPAPNAA